MNSIIPSKIIPVKRISILVLTLALAASAALIPGQTPPGQAPAGTSTNPPMPITSRTFSDLARKVIPSVVTVYVKRDLTKSLTPEQKKELDRLRQFFQDPNLRQFMPPGLQSPDQNDEEGEGSGDEGGSGSGGGGGDGNNAIITQGSGSGVIVSADGYIVTNWHVVGDKKDQAEIRVVLADETELSGKDVQLIYSSQFIDLALLKINRTGLTPLTFGDSDKVQIGDWVATAGSPLELKATVTQGIVSAKHRAFGSGLGDMIQTDAPINPGSSGGALVNLNGELIGINRMIATLSQSGGWAGYGFAIPSNQVKYFVDQVLKSGKVEFGYIGIFMANEDQDTPKLRQALGLNKDAKGVLVMGTTPGSPADKAGIQEGDFITAVDNRPVTGPDTLLAYVARRPVGSSITLSYLRPVEGATPRQMTATLKIEPRPTESELQAGPKQKAPSQPQMEKNRLGVQVEPYRGPEGQGLRVTAVQPGSTAAKAGIRRGDILTRLNFVRLRTPEDLRKALQSRKPGEPMPLSIIRNGQSVMIPIE